MPMRQNRYYNNPELGAAFSNLASVFAPPSAGDLMAYEQMATERQERETASEDFRRLADMLGPEVASGVRQAGASFLGNYPQFDLYQQSQTVDDPAAIDAGAYAVHGNYGSTAAGQEAELLNALEQERLKQAGATHRQMIEPIAANENQTVFLPPELAGAIGMPETVRGNINLAPGERTVAPGGQVFEGAPELPSESEVVGGILAGLPENEQRARALQGVQTENVVGPAGQPEIAFRPDAVGQEPFIEPSSSSIKMYQTADGRTGRTVDGVVDLVTNEPIPPDAVVGSISDTSDTFGDAEMRGVREDMLGRRDALASMDNAIGYINEQLAAAEQSGRGGADAVVGIVGNAAGALNTVRAQVGALASLAGGDDSSLEGPGGEVVSWEEANQGLVGQLQSLGIQSNEIQSAIIDLAYTVARANKPSGRLSVNDVNNAMAQIGGNLGDATAFRATLDRVRNKVEADYRSFEENRFGAYGDRVGIDPMAPPEPQAPAPAGGGSSSSGVQWRVVE